MYLDLNISLSELVECLAEAVDLVSPALADHHKRVAYISFNIARQMGLTLEEQNNLTLAGYLHDGGGLSFKERLEALRFEVEKPYQHAELGYRLFNKFKPFASIALLIRYHHLPWEEVEKVGSLNLPESVLLGSSILHLADRAAVLIDPHKDILGQNNEICRRIIEYSGKMFNPRVVTIFTQLAAKEFFWLDLLSPTKNIHLLERANYFNIELNLEALVSIAKIFGQIIDFRSSFTATHSSGTAACAEVLARLVGFSEQESLMLKVAGFLHDLGKIVIPEYVLNKNEPLTEVERNIVKSHSYYTYRLLQSIKNLGPITSWAAFHHEKLNGSGYPFHLDAVNLTLGSRVIGISDIFTALTEDRPYRKGMSPADSLHILSKMAERNELDVKLIALLHRNCGEIDEARIKAHNQAVREYQEFWDIPAESLFYNLNSLTKKYLEMGRPID